MGYSTPSIRQNGYFASNEVIFLDSTEYGDNTTTYDTKVTFKLVEALVNESQLKFSAEIKTDGAGVSPKAYLQMISDGVIVWSNDTTNLAYTEFNQTLDMWLYPISAIFELQIKGNTGVDTTYMKNVRLLGTKSPIVIL